MTKTTRVVLSVLIGAAVAFHLHTLQTLLPALYTPLLSQIQTLVIPPLIIIVCFLLTNRVPPILTLIPLLTFPPITAASFPLTSLFLLSIIFSLIYISNPFPTALSFLLAFSFDFASLNLPSYILSNLPSSSHLPSIIVALAITHLSTRSHTLTTLFSSPKPQTPKTRNRKQHSPRPRHAPPQQFIYITVFSLSLLFTTLTTPPLTNLLYTINPRPLPNNFTILDQDRGTTGLISVVQATNSHRMLTADMSVLGGYHIKQGYHPDSIFTQFYVHEAVRLSRLPGEPDDTTGGRDGRALCIGVGVGVVAQSLHQHSTIVDPVELDPVVARFAKKWFQLEPDVIVADGLRIIAQADNQTYDFVIHDVFTGGAIATDLFSVATFEDIKRIMKKDGVLVVNFVGGVEHPPTPATGAAALVYNRLKQVFGNVRAFSDGLGSRNHNIVFFAGVAGEVSFREPTEHDALGSPGRMDALERFQEHEIGDILDKVDVRDGTDWLLFAGMWDIASEHRAIMREVHPPTLWVALLAAEKRRFAGIQLT